MGTPFVRASGVTRQAFQPLSVYHPLAKYGNYNLDQLYVGLGDSLVSQRARLVATLDTQRKLIFDK